MSKLSKRAREERRQMIKLAGFSALALGVGVGGFIGVSRFSSPSTALAGTTLDERIAEGALEPYVLRLVGEGSLDAVVIGSSDCGFCRTFVAEGLEDFVQEAAALDMTVGYLALGNGPGALASTRALTCMAPAGGDPVDLLRATYAISAEINAQGAAGANIGDLTTAALETLGATQSLDVAGCLMEESPTVAAARAQTIARVFDVRGTPSFYVASQGDARDIRLFSGFASSAGTVRQLRRNRLE
jgi:hypothetical protein